MRTLFKQPRFALVLTFALFSATALGALLSGSAHASSLDSLDGPDVTIISGEQRTIYEYRQNGELRMVRVVPNWGKPYYLYPKDGTEGFGNLERSDTLLPTWVIFEF